MNIDKSSLKMKDKNVSDRERSVKERTRKHEDRKWSQLIKELHNYTCQICNSTGIKMVAHHLENYYHNPKLRTEITNGVCLCLTCHDDFHTLFGWANTTRRQYLQFKKLNAPNLIKSYADRKIVRIDFTEAIMERRIQKRIYKSIRHAGGKSDKECKAIIYCCLGLWTCYQSPKDRAMCFWQFYDQNLLETESKILKFSPKTGFPTVIYMGKKPNFNFNTKTNVKGLKDKVGRRFQFMAPGL